LGAVLRLDAVTADFESERLAMNAIDKSDYNVLIYSPVLGTGFDIQRYHDYTYLIANGNQLAPNDWVQMVGRVRNTGGLGFFIAPRALNLLDTQNSLDAQLNDRVQASSVPLGYIDETDAIAKDAYTRLTASRNYMKNNAYGFFIAMLLKEGWGVPTITDIGDETIKGMFKPTREAIKAMKLDAILSIPSNDYKDISDEIYQEFRRDQELHGIQLITREAHWANQAWRVFDLTGITNNEETVTFFSSKANVKAFLVLNDFTRGKAYGQDQKEADERMILHKRQFATGKDAVIRKMLVAIWGTDDLAQIAQLGNGGAFSEAELIERLTRAGLADDGITGWFKAKLATHWDWRAGKHSDSTIAIVRYTLARIGMKLAYDQVMKDGERFYIYRLDLARYELLERFAKARDAYLIAKARGASLSRSIEEDSLDGCKEYHTGQRGLSLLERLKRQLQDHHGYVNQPPPI
jgi:hypothetical protein